MEIATVQKKSVPKATGAHPKAASATVAVDLATSTEVPFIQHKSGCACGGGCPRCQIGPTIQTKLTIGKPNDKYEQEADRVADQVMRMPEPRVQRQPEMDEEEEELVQTKPQITPLVQRQIEPEEEEEETVQIKSVTSRATPVIQRQIVPEEEEAEEELALARRAPGAALQATPEVAGRITRLRGSGGSLPDSTRTFFESGFARDFSGVRVHEGPQAADLAHSVHARAFTVGRDIVFGAGQYSPDTLTGRRLLAHELTHVVQQRQAAERGASDGPAIRTNMNAETIQRVGWGGCRREKGRRIGASNPFFYISAELYAVGQYVARRSSHTVVSNIDLTEHFPPKNKYEKVLKGALNKDFKGVSKPLRPDIFDLENGEIYDVKTSRGAKKGVRQISAYVKLLEAIEALHTLPPNHWRHGKTLGPFVPLTIRLIPT